MMKTTFTWLVLSFIFAVNGQTVSDTVDERQLLVADPLIEKGLYWLWQQRDPNYGFKDFTAKAIAALQLANATAIWYASDNPQSQLVVKQMEIELLVQLSRHRDLPPVPSEIAEYSLALSSICRDPRQFHGFDLIGVLSHHELLLDWESAISSLAICASGNHVRKRQLRRLLDATESHENLSIETLSMVMMALNCIVHDHRNRNLQHYLMEPIKVLGRKQKSDGSFGSQKSTAMAIQALQASDPSHHHWNGSAAIAYLRNKQNDDGSFGETKDVEFGIIALLALGPRSISNIKDLDCNRGSNYDYNSLHLAQINLSMNLTMHEPIVPNENKTTTEIPLTNDSSLNAITEAASRDGKITMTYVLWIGLNESTVRSVNITSDPGINFYYIMQLAAEEDENFAFQATEWPNGHYIHTLAGCKEEPMTYHYWLLYKLSSMPNMKTPPTNQFVAPLGVDDLIINDRDIYLFWYKKL